MYTHTETFTTDIAMADKTLLLNIETTGLSSRNAFIYMIGLGWQHDAVLTFECLLAESRMDERKLLDAFHDRLLAFDQIFTYGGHSFTYRFLTERWYNYHDEKDNLFDGIQTDDLQKDISAYKAFLPLADLKKLTVEQFLRFNRQSLQTGKEMIDIYTQWERSHATDLRAMLLAHHTDDMQSLIQLQSLSAYTGFWKGYFTVLSWQIEKNHCIFRLSLAETIMQPIQYQTEYAVVSLDANEAIVTVQVYSGRLKHFLPGPVKDYYYLPAEDQAVHRSVACYVDKAYRQKATAATCYITRESFFLPTGQNDLYPHFQEGYHTKPYYICYDPKTWQKNPQALYDYIISVIQ